MNFMQKDLSDRLDQIGLYTNILRCCGYTPEQVEQVATRNGYIDMDSRLENLRGHVSYLYHKNKSWK